MNGIGLHLYYTMYLKFMKVNQETVKFPWKLYMMSGLLLPRIQQALSVKSPWSLGRFSGSIW